VHNDFELGEHMTQLSRHSAKRNAPQHPTRAANVVIAALIATAGFAGAPSALAATKGPLCSLASSQRVKSALGITVGPPVATRNATVTVCQFEESVGLLVRFQTNDSASNFAAGQKSFDKHGYPTKTVNGIGTKAYSSSTGKANKMVFNTLVVLQNKTELLITAAEPVAKLDALAKLILPSL
jgi:hypothetical protein